MRSCRLATLGMVLALAGHACAAGKPRLKPAIRQVTPTVGFPGEGVLLTGSHFGAFPGTVALRVAGESYDCDVVSWSARQVVVRVPAKLDEVLGSKESYARFYLYTTTGWITADFRVVGRALRPAIRALSSATIRPGQRLMIVGSGFLDRRHGKVWFVRPMGKRRRARESRVQQWTKSRIVVTLGHDFDDAPRGVWQVRVANWRGYQAEADITFVPPGGADAEPAAPPAAKAPRPRRRPPRSRRWSCALPPRPCKPATRCGLPSSLVARTAARPPRPSWPGTRQAAPCRPMGSTGRARGWARSS